MQERRGSVYLAVLGTVSVVTILTLAGVALRKNINERARMGIDTGEARILAESAAELTLQGAMEYESVFRSRAATGTVFSSLPLGSGSISATAVDLDTGTTPVSRTSRYGITTEATAGSSRSRLSFQIRVPDSEYLALAKEYGAIAYWPLNEYSGITDAEDMIGGHDGTYGSSSPAGSTTHDDGDPTPQFTYGSHRVRVPHHSDFLLNKGTIAFWVRWDYRPALGADAAAVSKEFETKNNRSYFVVYLEGDGDLVVLLNNDYDEGGGLKVSGRISTGRWYHLAVSWDNELSLYIDGVYIGKHPGVNIGFDAGHGVDANTADWMFGARNTSFSIFGAPQHPTGGSVARVALFDSDLKDKEIQTLYEADSAPHGFELEPESFARVVD